MPVKNDPPVNQPVTQQDIDKTGGLYVSAKKIPYSPAPKGQVNLNNGFGEIFANTVTQAFGGINQAYLAQATSQYWKEKGYFYNGRVTNQINLEDQNESTIRSFGQYARDFGYDKIDTTLLDRTRFKFYKNKEFLASIDTSGKPSKIKESVEKIGQFLGLTKDEIAKKQTEGSKEVKNRKDVSQFLLKMLAIVPATITALQVVGVVPEGPFSDANNASNNGSTNFGNTVPSAITDVTPTVNTGTNISQLISQNLLPIGLIGVGAYLVFRKQ